MKIKNPIKKTVLKNGLTVLLMPDSNTPLVSLWLWHRAGSAMDIHGKTGTAHLVEHINGGHVDFKGEKIDTLISKIGGVYNAATSFDFITYYFTVPAAHFDLVLQIVANQLKNDPINPADFDLEKKVVTSEREWLDNEPLNTLYEAVQKKCFGDAPYGHLPIGYLSDIQSISLEDINNFRDQTHLPGNTILSLAGDIDYEFTLKRLQELFEGIPSDPLPKDINKFSKDFSVDGDIRLQVDGPGETTYVQISYPAPAVSDPDFFSFLVLDSLLAGPSNLNIFGGSHISNKTSRLYRALVDTGLAIGLRGDLLPTIAPYIYNIVLIVDPQHKSEDALSTFDKEIERLQREMIELQEITRSIKQARASYAFDTEHITNRAFWLGYAEIFANYNWFLTYLDKLAHVTPASLQKAAQKYLRSQNRAVGTYIPTGNEDAQ